MNTQWTLTGVTVTIVLLLTSILIFRNSRFSQGEAVGRRVRGHICSWTKVQLEKMSLFGGEGLQNRGESFLEEEALHWFNTAWGSKDVKESLERSQDLVTYRLLATSQTAVGKEQRAPHVDLRSCRRKEGWRVRSTPHRVAPWQPPRRETRFISLH